MVEIFVTFFEDSFMLDYHVKHPYVEDEESSDDSTQKNKKHKKNKKKKSFIKSMKKIKNMFR